MEGEPVLATKVTGYYPPIQKRVKTINNITLYNTFLPMKSGMEIDSKYCYGYMRVTHILAVCWGLPITRRKITDNFKRGNESDVQGHRYSFDWRVAPVWLALAALDAYVVYNNYLIASRYVGESFRKCFEESYCFAVIELANRNLGPFSMLACQMFGARRHKAAALAGTERVLAFIRETDAADRRGGTGSDDCVRLSPAIKYYSAAILVAYAANLALYTVVQPAAVMAMFVVNVMGQIAMYNLIIFQYYVLERGYARVNRLLETTDVHRDARSAARWLARLADFHDHLGRLVDHVNRANVLGLMCRWPYTIVRLVMLVFRVIEFAPFVHADSHPFSRTAAVLMAEHVIEIIMFLHQLSFICVTGTRLFDQVNIFCIRVKARKVRATTGGFVIINMGLLKSICGIIATYFLVLIQFKFQKNTSRPLHQHS